MNNGRSMFLIRLKGMLLARLDVIVLAVADILLDFSKKTGLPQNIFKVLQQPFFHPSFSI